MQAKEEFWWIYVINKKNHGLVTAPYLVTNLVKQEEVMFILQTFVKKLLNVCRSIIKGH